MNKNKKREKVTRDKMKLNKKGDKMRACHDDPEIKSNILAQLKRHRDADLHRVGWAFLHFILTNDKINKIKNKNTKNAVTSAHSVVLTISTDGFDEITSGFILKAVAELGGAKPLGLGKLWAVSELVERLDAIKLIKSLDTEEDVWEVLSDKLIEILKKS